MIAPYYQYIYLLVLGFVLVLSSRYYSSHYWRDNNGRAKEPLSFFIMALLVIIIGVRPVHDVFADMVGYNSTYLLTMGQPFVFDPAAQNLVFDNLFSLFSSLGIPPVLFFLIISAFYFGCLYYACKEIFPNDLLLSFLVCLTAFSTFSYATNGIKAGAAASLFLLAIAKRDRPLLFMFLAFLSWGFHHSMIMVIVAYPLSLLVKRTKWFFLMWVVCLLTAALHIDYFQSLFASIANDKGARYLLPDADSFVTGFRIDFILYSSIPIIIGYWMVFIKRIHSQEYELLLRLYLTTNSIWMLCMYASFTNRIAYLSWFLYPIVLIYPFLLCEWSNNQGFYAQRTALMHYAFTLFMAFVYY